MTENIKIALIVATPPTIVGLLGLLHQIVMEIRASARAIKSQAAKEVIVKAVQEQSANIQVIEKATNSMKDALVKATAIASKAEGVAEEKQRAKEETASFDAGVASAKPEPIDTAHPNP